MKFIVDLIVIRRMRRGERRTPMSVTVDTYASELVTFEVRDAVRAACGRRWDAFECVSILELPR